MAKIKSVIFDLDDTLFDCSGQLVEAAKKRAAEAIAGKVEGTTAKEVLERQGELYSKHGPMFDIFDMICSELKAENRKECVDAALRAYNSDEVGKISLFPEAVPLFTKLKKQGIKLVLITSGIHSRQQKKIRLLGLKKWMDLVLIHDPEKGVLSKHGLFRKAMKKLFLKPNEIVSVGDRIQREIKIGNRLGMHSVRFLHGRFREMKPRNDFEEPDFEIESLGQLSGVLSSIESGKNGQPKIVAVGGGTGLPMVLSGLKQHTKNLSAIVTVTDSGRSSGMLRKDLHILPPGDLRNCLIALSDSEKLLLDLFRYRFDCGGLEGHSFGNLFIAALAKTTGSFEKAVKEASRILAIRGRVLPSTLQDTHVCAELENGSIVEEEFNVRSPDKGSPIKRVFLKHEVKPLQETLDAIEEADLIVLGPGSLFTSIIPNLMVKGIPEAMAKSSAKVVYIANIMTQTGQTEHFSLSRHVEEIEKYLGTNVIDFVLVNSEKPSEKLLRKYRDEENALMVELDYFKLPKGIKVVERPMIERGEKQALWNKQYLLRHDAGKLGRVLLELV